MASNYVTASSFGTVDVISQTEASDVQAVAIYTQPHGTYLVVLVPNKIFKAGKSKAYIAGYATTVENLWKAGFITGAVYGQDVDPGSGLLTGYLYFKVTFQAEDKQALPYSTTVRVPVSALSTETAFTTQGNPVPYGQQISEAYASMAGLSEL